MPLLRSVAFLSAALASSCGPSAREIDLTRHACGAGLELRLISSSDGAVAGTGAVLVIGQPSDTHVLHARSLMRHPTDETQHTDYVIALELSTDGSMARGTLLARRPSAGAPWGAGEASMAEPEPFAVTRGGGSTRVVIDAANALAVTIRVCPVAAPLFCDLHGPLACDDTP